MNKTSENTDGEIGAYLFYNAETGEIYVGSSRRMAKRHGEHLAALRAGCHPNRRFQAAYNRNPNFDFYPRLCGTRDEAFALEQSVIDRMKWSRLLLNLSHDARYCNAGRPLTPEHKAKLSAAFKGRPMHPNARTAQLLAVTGKPLSEEHRKKVSLGLTGRPVSAETRQRLSLANTGKTLPALHRQKLSMARKQSEAARAAMESLRILNTGRPLTDEHKAKIAAGNRGKKASPKAIELLRERNRTRTVSEETKNRMSRSARARPVDPAKIKAMMKVISRPVKVDGVLYASASEAARAHGVDSKTALRRAGENNKRYMNWEFVNGQ